MKFSIITCTYNSEKFLQKNILSIKKQLYNNWEHIFIDANSQDDTRKIIDKYREQFPDKVKVYSFPAKGISNAMNNGIKYASGDYLIHMHSDDSFYDNNVLEDVFLFLKKKKYPDWIYGLANVVEENGNNFLVYPNKPWLHFHNYKSIVGKYLIKFIQFIPHQSVFIKKEVFEKFGMFDESLNSKMDPDLWIRIRKKTKWFFYKRIICNYCIRSGAQSSSKSNINENMNNYNIVQKRYLNAVELFFAKLLNKIKKYRNNSSR